MRLLLVLFILILTACGGKQTIVPVGDYGIGSKSTTHVNKPKPTQSTTPAFYKVKKGDTLYSISWRYGMNYKSLAKLNNINSPYKIYIGQKLRFTSTKKVTASKRPTTKVIPHKVTTKNTPNTKIVKKSPSTKTKPNQSLTWRWPTQGKVISTYSKSAAGRKGIDIAGKLGQSVISAASGKVVYAGEGLPRYGKLLIIKHNDVYLSAYAHNTTLLVKEGAYVKSGQKIATLGRTGTQRHQLHFEIRRNGKPVDPMRFLPKR